MDEGSEQGKGIDTTQRLIHNLASPARWVPVRCEEDAGIAQLVERNLAKVEVASSRLVSRSSFQGKARSAK
jgi:hypothetical protein